MGYSVINRVTGKLASLPEGIRHSWIKRVKAELTLSFNIDANEYQWSGKTNNQYVQLIMLDLKGNNITKTI